MRTDNRDPDGRAVSWEALPAENRRRIARILAQTLAELLFAPADRDDDRSGRCGEPG